MKARRVLFWAILILFVGLSVWWVFTIPFNRKSVYSAIPSNAVFVSEHERVAERWEAVARNPLTLCLLKSLGIDTNEVDRAIQDPDVAKNIQRFAARDTVIAYVPALGLSGQPAWVLSSWAGSPGQLLRWVLACGVLKDLKKAEGEGNRRVWYTEIGKGKSEQFLSVAVVQGVLLGCLSLDRTAVQYVADRVERGAPVVTELQQRLDPGAEAGEPPGVLDRGWMDWSWVSGRPEAGKVRYALSSHGEKGSEGWVRGTVRLPDGAMLRDTVEPDEVAQLIGDAPDAFVVAPFSYVEALLRASNSAPAVAIINQFLRASAAETNSVFACMSGGDYSGRILSLKVPTILAGMKIRNPDTVAERIRESVDQLNREYKLGLMASRCEVRGYRGTVLGLNRNDLFASLNPEERPAFVVATNWLVLGSAVEAMGTILGRGKEIRDRRSSASSKATADKDVGGRREAIGWLEGLEKAGDATAYAWIDLEAANQGLRNGIAVYTLSLLVTSKDGRTESRSQLGNLSAWIDALRSLKTCRLRLTSDPSGFDLQFKFGVSP